MQVRSQKDFASGLLFVAIGAGFSYVATTYSMGTSAKMGPGFFPFWLGLLLSVLGAIITMTAMSQKSHVDTLEKWHWPSIIWVLGSVVFFGLVLAHLGLMLSILALVFISAMASHEFHWKGTIVNAIILNVIAYIAFIWGLKLQFQVWPTIFTA
ncbi:tripartite tricarboxylate transporter TctB family protein [Polynucleobacter sp. 30F-ANTBAC]|jgi:Tripartite tricarboxylate transporter TctB family|uniref:tripartite tricarboxylate transporter TctB family protein n=1 Tax=Polynucleobacter sp. 30F-ANTBAC TaxID=2689095 RepID=UPI001C0B115F|nr:tripartite tricarboxylate transporter TctB family protein [Polynucleobacter sp. 30F-ANTBAC]MBU3600358.1 tripartite tricarboxylate transporter TctB family protein [Polynucleobacter sp. 30F-ANTBAC]